MDEKKKAWEMMVKRAKTIAGTMGPDMYVYRAINMLNKYVIKNFLKE